MKKFKNIASVSLLIVSFALVILLVVTRLQGHTPQLFGYRLLRVSSSSMTPVLNVGDIILTKSLGCITDVEVGDIITYYGEVGSYSGKLITHQVTLGPYVSNGNYHLQTMGIANNYTDPEISQEQVVGKMICTLPILSGIYDFFSTPWGLILILAFLALLFVSEVFTLKNLVKSEAKLNKAEKE